jgi:pimeloyl-ACP methyl ester carboxylesterase/uncharacterized protein YndB with AHSA1/START domain
MESNTKDRELLLTRTLNAPIDLVWEVWTNPEHIAKWWGPNGFTNTISKMDVKPGGEWHLVMHGPDGTDFKNKTIFKEVVHHQKIVYVHDSAPTFTATIQFEAQGERTLLIWHMLFESREQFIQVVKTFKADEGQRQNVDKLEVYLANRIKNSTMSNNKNLGQHADINGISMYYEIHGEGDTPLVLIHGGGSTLDTSFGRLIPLLATGNKVIAVELQAHGRTTDRDTPETFEQDADDVAALLKHLRINKANVLGFSNGGTTTLQIAIKYPQLVNKIVVVAGGYRRDGFMPGFFDGMQHVTIDHMPAILKDEFLKVTPDQTRLQTMFDKDKDRVIAFKDYSDDDIRSIKAPALCMVSDNDVMTIEHTLQMSRLIENSEVVVLPGAHGGLIGAIESGISASSKLPAITVMLIQEFLDK